MTLTDGTQTEAQTPAAPAEAALPATASIDETIAHYTTIANAERDRLAAAAPEAGSAGAESSDGVNPTSEPADAATGEPPADAEAPEPGDAKLSRRARADAELRDTLTRTETEREQFRLAVETRQNEERQILTELSEYCGTEQQYQAAKDRAAEGDETAKAEFARMKQWRQVLVPVERSYRAQMARVFGTIPTLEGMTAQDFQAIKDADNPVDAVKRAYDVGFRSGQAKALAASKVSASAAATSRVARQGQPVTPGGVSKGSATLESLVDPKTGLLSDEAERRIRAGEFKGVALT